MPSSVRSAVFHDDSDLILRIKRFDPAAMGELYDRYGRLAFTIIVRIVLDRKVAEDLLAQTFVKVWNQIERWEDDRQDDLCLWLLLLARNHAVEHLRALNEPLPRTLPRLTTFMQPSVLQEFPRPRNSDEGRAIQRSLASLSDAEMRILEMSCFDGLPASEIAVRTAQSLAAVKETIRDAVAKLGGGEQGPR